MRNILQEKKESLQEIISYIIIGGATTLINYFVYLLSLQLGIKYLTSNTIAWVFAVSFAYITNRTFVFHSKNQIGKEFVSFVSLRFLTLLLENLLLSFFVQFCVLPPIISKIAVSFITVISNYFICKCQIFQKPARCLNHISLEQKKGDYHE